MAQGEEGRAIKENNTKKISTLALNIKYKQVETFRKINRTTDEKEGSLLDSILLDITKDFERVYGLKPLSAHTMEHIVRLAKEIKSWLTSHGALVRIA